jgi:hypothetical protein
MYALESQEFYETLNGNEIKAWELLLDSVDRASAGLLTSGRTNLTKKERDGIGGILTLAGADIETMAAETDWGHPWTRGELLAGMGAVTRLQKYGYVSSDDEG